jgi:DNA-directed RNA polymerase subunit alpha
MLIIQRPTIQPMGDEVANRQKFVMSPLEPGFGHTIGNSLRRTLLSSIPGAAVTTLRFDDALHEFSTIPDVKEDVTEIILNIKDLILKSYSVEPVIARIDIRGSKDVTAEDIHVTSEVEIINKDLHIASVNSKGRLAVDLTIEQGRGYLSSERALRSNTIGVIPIDAIFSPVRRVSIDVEPTRVEQSTDFEKLILDIETDGSLSPAEALASAGETLKTLMELVATMSEDPIGLQLGEISTTVVGSPDLELLIEDLELSERPMNCLKRAQIATIGELIQHSEEELLAFTNFGQKSLDEVIAKLDERGLALRGHQGA